MGLGEPWTPGEKGQRGNEDELLATYFEQEGGLLFTEVNVAYLDEGGVQRRIDAVRVTEPPREDTGAYSYGSENRRTIWSFIENYTVELIEVHGWGFHLFGQLLGKAGIVRDELDPHDLRLIAIPTNRDVGFSDPPTAAIFEEYGIDVTVVE